MRFAQKRFLCFALLCFLLAGACKSPTACPAFEQQTENRKPRKAKKKKHLYAKDRDLFGNKR
ncbi:MAG: hypothetical protein C0424_03305 [Sphingobacteriaceae bacterium]|nr:hypothetical protein [Sphingobacteriaceae bacterium]